MSKALVIAEKPSVAADIARALGRLERIDDAFENEQYVVSSAVGHLVELALPSEMEKKRGKWTFAALPVIPEEFELKPIESNEDRFKMLKRLLKRADVTEIINACDAGREGELIFRMIVKLSGVKKPIRRLWLQSMTPEAIRTAFQRLRSDEEMITLAKAAFCRAESDWLVGINGTRAMTAFNSKAGGFQLTPVGRVQTPTLAILVEREKKIRAFKPRTYFEVYGDFGVQAGSYRGRWLDENFRKGTDEDARAGTPLGTRKSRGDPRQMHRQNWRRHRGEEADQPGPPPALRSYQPATGRKRPVRLQRPAYAPGGAAALREAQGTDLSAYRQPVSARGLSRHGAFDDGQFRRSRAWRCTPTRRWRIGGSGRANASSTTPKFPITTPSFPPGWPRRIWTRRSKRFSTWWRGGSSRCSTRRLSSRSPPG